MRCAICCSVIETVLSAMLQSISVQTFHQASQCVLTSCQLISEAAMVFFWLSHVPHVVGLVYCIPGEKFGFKYLSVFSTPSGACMLQAPYFSTLELQNMKKSFSDCHASDTLYPLMYLIQMFF